MLLNLSRSLVLLFFVGAAELTASAPAKLEIPTDKNLGFFIGSRDETLSTMKRVGLLPVRLPIGFDTRDDAKIALQELTTHYLTLAGMEVVPSDSYTQAYDRLNVQLGGVYNPETGEIKSEQMNAVVNNATREFNEKEHLNGNVIITVRGVEAKFYGTDAYFTGAKECSLGRLPPNAVASFFLGSPNSQGSLSAYSVLIQLTNNQGKVVFGQMGGIQLSHYYDPDKSKGGNGFLSVAAKDLLLDRTRLDRAIRIATQPLLQTPEQIAAGEKNPTSNPRLIDHKNLPLPPEGLSPQIESPLLVPREQILTNIHKVFLAPFSLGKFSMPQETQDRYLVLISEELKPLNWEVVQSAAALEVWRTEIKNVKGLFDPYSGKIDDERIKAMRKKALMAFGLKKDDAVLWPSLIRISAPYKSENARWDGVGQNVFTLEPMKRRNIWSDPVSQSEGSIAAVSLNILLRDAEDNIVYQSRGGIQLIQQIKDTKAVDLAPTELFLDQPSEPSTVHIALRNLVLSADDLDDELHPNKDKSKKKEKKGKEKH